MSTSLPAVDVKNDYLLVPTGGEEATLLDVPGEAARALALAQGPMVLHSELLLSNATITRLQKVVT